VSRRERVTTYSDIYWTFVQVPHPELVKPLSLGAMVTIAEPFTLLLARMSPRVPLKPARRAQ
jgi:hypothetical protein